VGFAEGDASVLLWRNYRFAGDESMLDSESWVIHTELEVVVCLFVAYERMSAVIDRGWNSKDSEQEAKP
jgi:hypothetical protein